MNDRYECDNEKAAEAFSRLQEEFLRSLRS